MNVTCRVITIHNNPENTKLPKRFKQLRLQLADVDTQDVSQFFDTSYQFIEEGRSAGEGERDVPPKVTNAQMEHRSSSSYLSMCRYREINFVMRSCSCPGALWRWGQSLCSPGHCIPHEALHMACSEVAHQPLASAVSPDSCPC